MDYAAPSALIRIGNEDLDSGSGGTYDHYNPVSGEVQATIPLAGKAEIDRAVEKAAAVAGEWRRTRPEVRREILNKLAVLIRENAGEFARLAAIDGGTTLPAGTGMAMLAAEWFAYYAGWPDKLGGELLSTFDTRGEFAYTTPEPYGVVGIIITWNGPIISIGMKVAPALAAGNCIVVKPAELTPFASDYFMTLARQAGVPDGVLSIMPGDVSAGEALVAHPKVEMISFTGGPIAARRILVACAEQMKPAVLELGGKSASLLFPDCDVDAACARAVQWSIGIMAGQGCALPTRLIVHESIHDEVVEKLKAIASAYKVGDPFEEGVAVGPVINAAAADRIMGMLDRVRSEGSGKIVMGGQRCGGALAGKNFIEPTIITDVDPDSEIAQIEVFGPVLIVQKFADEDEAVRLANATQYGLAAYIQSNDVKRVHRLAERLKAGGVYVNGAVQINPHTPFGGLGVSGYGKEGGRAGIDEFLRYKTIAIA
ncbi:aldehyde dehydrogenase family protein [Sphingomonas immobilis]|uniref:Aldehyde dehydrogenase family protein n=1 Tax=Sphingomonas immobilis TaxID=3063997 RepID=A0ABT8ZX36_9SPHN|nr:aldehyde dehydrogenase family protein [Sphingomonas sp. CA1-15]MDO7842113.1 aldehyde dehydrogenase family protein [Sphingomonas sp. CA1-15]